jgi:FAD/FMN-containing dehydrogenase
VTSSHASRELAGPPPGFRGVFRTDADARAVYSEAAGIHRLWPSAIAVPEDATDVVRLVEWARDAGVTLTARGSGSSMAGGAVGAGVVVDLSRLRECGPVDGASQRIAVGPGVLCREVNAQAAPLGLHLPVDPSSSAFCTVGGMAATNAAGAHTLKYGSMRKWVAGLDCVFTDGSRAFVRRGQALPNRIPAIDRFLSDVAPTARATNPELLSHPGVRKEASGYGLADYARSGELVDLLVGSEGTLALFVGLELELAPRAHITVSALAAYKALDDAVAGASIARNHGASACELLDRTFLDLIRESRNVGGKGPSLSPDTEAVLLIEIEADSAGRGPEAVRALEQVLRAGGAARVVVALEPAAQEALWELRHAASPALARLDPALKSMQLIEDGAVPPERLADYVRGVRASLGLHKVQGAIFGHAGDAHVHVNALIDVRDGDWRLRATGLLADVTQLVRDLGGTLSGEHGDGRLRAPLLAAVWESPVGDGSTPMELFRAVKAAFDPHGIFNPGVKIATPGEEPLGDVKYDPALAPLPPRARRALDAMTDERGYATPRLALLDRENAPRAAGPSGAARDATKPDARTTW